MSKLMSMHYMGVSFLPFLYQLGLRHMQDSDYKNVATIKSIEDELFYAGIRCNDDIPLDTWKNMGRVKSLIMRLAAICQEYEIKNELDKSHRRYFRMAAYYCRQYLYANYEL